MPVNINEAKTFDPYAVYLNEIGSDRFKYNKLHDKLKSLPEKFQDFIFDIVPGNFIKDRVSLPLGLNEKQSKETAKIVMDLLVADWYLGDAVNQIVRRAGVEEQKAKTIAGLIVTELFASILEDLKKMHIEKFAKNISSQQQVQTRETGDRIINLKNNQ